MQPFTLPQFIILCVIFLCTICILAFVNDVIQMSLVNSEMMDGEMMDGQMMDGEMMDDQQLADRINSNDKQQCHFSINDYIEAEPTGFDETDMSGMRPAPVIPEAVLNQVADANGDNFFVGKDGCDKQILNQ